MSTKLLNQYNDKNGKKQTLKAILQEAKGTMNHFGNNCKKLLRKPFTSIQCTVIDLCTLHERIFSQNFLCYHINLSLLYNKVMCTVLFTMALIII